LGMDRVISPSRSPLPPQRITACRTDMTYSSSAWDETSEIARKECGAYPWRGLNWPSRFAMGGIRTAPEQEIAGTPTPKKPSRMALAGEYDEHRRRPRAPQGPGQLVNRLARWTRPGRLAWQLSTSTDKPVEPMECGLRSAGEVARTDSASTVRTLRINGSSRRSETSDSVEPGRFLRY
jgi:hypothetical protein